MDRRGFFGSAIALMLGATAVKAVTPKHVTPISNPGFTPFKAHAPTSWSAPCCPVGYSPIRQDYSISFLGEHDGSKLMGVTYSGVYMENVTIAH